MATDIRKVGRTVRYRTAVGRIRPAVITAVGAGTLVNLRVGHSGETYTNVPKWDRTTPAVAGWKR